jgi:hypothetical protein
MSRRAIAMCVGLSMLAGSLVAGEPPPLPAPAELVGKLGSDEFREREAAGKRLDELGVAALDALRLACRSEDPEVARRARELVGRIEWRHANEVALAPTLVELSVENAPLADVLASLSKQTGYTVALAGDATKRVTLKTGKVPFWEAVRAVCDATDLQVAAAGGFVAPDSPLSVRAAAPVAPMGPGGPRPLPQPGFRVPAQPGLPGPVSPAVEAAKLPPGASSPTSVVLEARPIGAPRRPAAVYGAVLVEAIAVPPAAAIPDVSVTLLQVWPEPRLNWQQTKGVKVTRALDRTDRALAAEPDLGQPPQILRTRGGVAVVQQVNGNVVLLNPGASDPTPSPAAFTPNVRQAVVKFRTDDRPADALREFSGSVIGFIRSGAERVATTALKPGEQSTADGLADATMRTTLGNDGEGKFTLTAELVYDPTTVSPSALISPAGDPGPVNRTVYGVGVTSADGKPYQVAPLQVSQTIPSRAQARQVHLVLRLALSPAEKGQAAPTTATFWATYNKPVEVPFVLRDVPVTGKK